MNWLSPEDIIAFQEFLASQNDRDFFNRIWSTPNEVYLNRLKAIGYEGYDCVLDCGCGYGQWSISLSALNKRVVGIDHNSSCITTSRQIAQFLGVDNVTFDEGSLEKLAYEDESFDALFSYSALYFTDFRLSLREFHRILRSGSRIYINTNDVGWYIYNIIHEHNKGEGYDPRSVGIEAIRSTIEFFSSGKRSPGEIVITPQPYLLNFLDEIGFKVIACGSDGKINLTGATDVSSFFREKYHGLLGPYEIVAEKISA